MILFIILEETNIKLLRDIIPCKNIILYIHIYILNRRWEPSLCCFNATETWEPTKPTALMTRTDMPPWRWILRRCGPASPTGSCPRRQRGNGCRNQRSLESWDMKRRMQRREWLKPGTCRRGVWRWRRSRRGRRGFGGSEKGARKLTFRQQVCLENEKYQRFC